GDNPVFPGMYEASLWSAGASLRAAELVAEGEVEVAANFAGGLHHAMPDHASGFCIFNDPVIAIHYLLGRGFRVAYVDADCHHGDGVQFAFYDTDRVLTISLHESGQYLFPGTGVPTEVGVGRGKGYSVNVPLYPYTDDEVYQWAFQQVVPPLVRAYRPDVLITQLGIDTHFQDPITHLQLTVQGLAWAVEELARLSPGRWLALGGGGYDVGAVIRGWTLAFGVMMERAWPDAIPPSFQEKHGLTALRDAQGPRIDPGVRQEARQYAERSVAEVRRLIFPGFGLSALA
ncbi:MAG: acetoin utilization protein AcuC, partial [Chloroflexi bacterium]|nr:acetoin utilization protein AcuC [Chloroflexota bacterium]